MRKVTASAVILTALTGCGQSPLHSRQGSFEAPTSDSDSSLAAANTLIGQRRGTTFPRATSAPDRVSTLDRISGKIPNRQATVYSRPGGSLSQRNSPAPVSSQAYLFSPSAPVQPDAAALNAANPALPELTLLDLGLTDLTTAIANAPSENASNSFPPHLTLALSQPSNAEIRYPVPAPTAPASAAPGSERYSLSDYAPRAEGDNLPQLKPAAPTDFANIPLANPVVSEASTPEAVPVGTAILQNLPVASVATLSATQASEYSSTPDGITSNSSLQNEPTLDSLLQTMPPRADTPLVIRDQANRESSQILPTELPIIWCSTTFSPTESPVETAAPVATQTAQPQVLQAQPPIEFEFELSSRTEDGQGGRTNATNPPSPLLAGLELEKYPAKIDPPAAPSLTVYVPIAEAPQRDELGTLILLPVHNWGNHELAPSPFPLMSKASVYEKTLLPGQPVIQKSLSGS